VKRFLASVSVVALAVLAASPAAASTTVPVAELLVEADAYDLKQVTVVGEIVGDYGDRGEFVWVQLNDDAYAHRPPGQDRQLAGTNIGISVRLSGVSLGDFGSPGGHGVRGPLVEVTGIFRNLHPELGGLTFIDATSVVLIEPSVTIAEQGPDLVALIIGSLLTAAGLLALAHRRDLLPHKRVF
jgi:hypothetical protein